MDLNSIMEFDHVITVAAGGGVTDGPQGAYAPSMLDDELDDSRWELITAGYTGQCGYKGPTMHNSEYIGGRLAEYILATPGVYVAIVSDHTCRDHDECECDGVEGWAVAYLKGSGS